LSKTDNRVVQNRQDQLSETDKISEIMTRENDNKHADLQQNKNGSKESI
jgi:hypothetical protein